MLDTAIRVDVLVLGAGVAGLAAAVKLASSSVSVLVLEGRNRIGGRIHSVKVTNNQQTRLCLDLGAQWIHGDDATDNPVAALTARCGLQAITTCPLENTLYTAAGLAVSEQQHDQWKQLYEGQFADFITDQQQGGCLGLSDTVADLQEAFLKSNQHLDEFANLGLEYLINTRIEQVCFAKLADDAHAAVQQPADVVVLSSPVAG